VNTALSSPSLFALVPDIVSTLLSFEYFGPKYTMDAPRSNMDNQNSPEYLDNIK
jgi:hypothetical protein